MQSEYNDWASSGAGCYSMGGNHVVPLILHTSFWTISIFMCSFITSLSYLIMQTFYITFPTVHLLNITHIDGLNWKNLDSLFLFHFFLSFLLNNSHSPLDSTLLLCLLKRGTHHPLLDVLCPLTLPDIHPKDNNCNVSWKLKLYTKLLPWKPGISKKKKSIRRPTCQDKCHTWSVESPGM